jgi:mannose-1-phosphate guanylyltransferase
MRSLQKHVRFTIPREEKSHIHKAYQQCINISIDYGIMEKADNVYVLPSAFGWSDLGTWASIYDLPGRIM